MATTSTFYSNSDYKEKQSRIVKNNWQKGIYSSLVKEPEKRTCRNNFCGKSFFVKPYEEKIFCSKNCSASFNNKRRIQSAETKRKITLALQGTKSPFKGIEKVLRVSKICQNCKGEFKVLPYQAKKRKFCSNKCAIGIIGRKTTSPKASKGKPGIRLDIDNTICFYSTWEANIARVFSLIDLTWQYAPRIFDLGIHTYRPDFYLPEHDMYIEVKNFMNSYSFQRDRLFREKYPQIKLEILSKKEYKEIEKYYRPLIDFWEL